jgi:taurine dioxygenase
MKNHLNDLQVIPSGAAAGAEIRGIDVSQTIDAPTFAAIDAAFNEHGVIFFRDQDITPRQHADFSARFGKLEVNFNSDQYGLQDTPEIFAIGNVEQDGRASALKGVGQTWHSDMCYAANPPRATMLYALQIPQLHGLTTGDTCFANAALAWDTLPEQMRSHIDGRQGVFDFTRRQRSRPVSAATVAMYPPVKHPIVRRHPYSDRQCLYVMADDCTGIDGIDEAQARALIIALASHVLRPEHIYRHQWRQGDLLMWDNCTVQHKALADYDAPQRRLLHRTTMAGPAPR